MSAPHLTAARLRLRAWSTFAAVLTQRYRKIVIASAIAGFVIAAAGAFAYWRIATAASTAAARFTLDTGAQATILYDVNDRPVFTLYTEQRVDVPLGRVSPHLVAAVLAAEDRRFYAHRGYDLGRFVAAGLFNLRAARMIQGASTITQQLVRMTNGDRDRTVSRKLREMLTAAAVERRFTKTAILETYLNKVYLGEGFYGVEAAAHGYYGKPASDVTPDEAATLAALIQSPSRYTQDDLAARVRARRNWILDAMHRARQIDDVAYRAATDAPLRMTPAAADSTVAATRATIEPRDGARASGLYFKEAVRRELMSRWPSSEVLSAGLRVFTTIDPAMQAAAEQSLIEHLAAIERQAATTRRPRAANTTSASPTSALQGSLVAIDPKTGYINVLVGGRDFAESPFDRARQARRQPGSAFKPLVYATALRQGYLPYTMLHDLDQPVDTPTGEYLPRGDHEAREMTVRQALVQSSNRAAVHMLQHVGMSSVLSDAQRFGIVSPLPAVPSLALGTGEVTLLELTSAFGVFANRGEYVEPTLIRRIESADGTLLYQARPVTRYVINENAAYLMTNMLADVIDHGTGTAVRRLGFVAPAAGKTGTTDGVADAWFVGYTPRLAAGVWIGYDDPHVIRKGAFASSIAVPVWATFLKAATEGRFAEDFSRPPGIERLLEDPLNADSADPITDVARDRDRPRIVVTRNATTGTLTATAASPRDSSASGKPVAPMMSAADAADVLRRQ